MDNYRRPVPPKPGDARHAVEGFVPAKTKTTDTRGQLPQAAPVARRTRTVVRRRRVRPLDMSLPQGESHNRHHMRPIIRKQARRLRATLMRSAFAVMALIVGVGTILVSQGYLNINRAFSGTAQTAAALQDDVDPNRLKGEGDGRINVLLVGIGGQGHAGGDLTDTLILASIDPVNNTAALLSVPRDLWVTIPGKGSMKINAAFALAKQSYMRKNNVKTTDPQAVAAGFVAIDQAMERVLGVPIHYNVMVNFQAFRQAVDTVGGVTVNVPEDLYDPTMAWENGRNPYLARKGTQQFDGKQALNYVRSRETSSDFARSQRQRAVMLALKDKAISVGVLANPAKLAGLMNTFGTNVQTDFSIGDASRMYNIFKRINNSKIASISLAGNTSTTSGAAGTDSLVTTGNINGQSIVMPKAGLENYTAIQEYVRGQLKDGYIVKEKARVMVLNGTMQEGLAAEVTARLKSYGYNVVKTGQAPSTGYTSTVLVDLKNGKKKYTKNYLEQRFNTTAVKTLPDTTIKPGTADFVVILGGDETGNN